MKKSEKTFDMKDVLIITGSLLIGFGLWKIYPPAAYLAIGAEMLFLGYR